MIGEIIVQVLRGWAASLPRILATADRETERAHGD